MTQDPGDPKRASVQPPRVNLAVRLLLAVIVGAFLGWIAYHHYWATPHALGRDFTQLWFAARDVLAGDSPYRAVRPELPYPYQGYFPYPLPAALIAIPFSTLVPMTAAALFVAIAMSSYMFAVTRHSAAIALAVLCSHSVVRAVDLAQPVPLVLAGYVIPPLAALGIIKPNLGLAVLVARPNWWTMGGGAALAGVAFAIQPTWVQDWVSHVRDMPFYASPVTVLDGGGPLLLLAALRWRIPEGRLLLACSLLPMNFIWYDQLALFLVVRSAGQALLLSAGSWASFCFVALTIPDGLGQPENQVYFRAPIVAMMYLPALIIVLRHPHGHFLPHRLRMVLHRRRHRLHPD